ncbi:ThiF family adenylyltransferase [Actinophytocola sp.]|uniref:ThiF family adenylyltransferase n=1 Tax=Actinophytocola sp. TaxID=1872138 RepID=UPI002ED03E47
MTLRVSRSDRTGVIRALSDGNDSRKQVDIPPKHFLQTGDDFPNSLWYRVPPETNLYWLFALIKYSKISLHDFASMVPNGFRQPGKVAYYAITHVPRGATEEGAENRDVKAPEFAMWHVSSEGAVPLDIDVQPQQTGVALLAPHWPVEDIRRSRILLVGAGSIGGAAAHALATAGIGALHLLDPGRLRWHNLPRHVCGSRHVGRLKVEALRADLELTRTDTRVTAHEHDVVRDTNSVRDLLTEIDVIVCTADGVLPRRVVSHLARRASVPAVLACVLADGAYGDLMRLWPWTDHGCYQCRLDALAGTGGLIPDLEPGSGYRTHHAMTTVGTDLHLIGQLAAKMAIATYLQSKGHHDQWFAGEHAVLALRPEPGWSPPYDLIQAGQVEWHPAPPPRPGCPTCANIKSA